MIVITYKTIKQYQDSNKHAKDALERWYHIVTIANWSNLSEIRETYNDVDFVGNDRYVFNIGGNKYRLVAMIHFSTRTVYVRFIGTHKEYDKMDCTTI